MFSRQAATFVYIEKKRNAGIELVDVLPAGAGAAGKSINDITLADDRISRLSES